MSPGNSTSMRLCGATSIYGSMNPGELLIRAGKIQSLDGDKGGDAISVNVEGFHLFPGLINAHDHLHLDVFPAKAPLAPYEDGLAWGADIGARVDSDPDLQNASAIPQETALRWGGYLNLLHGVTLVQHHDAYHWRVFERRFPIRVIRRYFHAHTPRTAGWLRTRHAMARVMGAPFLIHCAEGTNRNSLMEIHFLAREGLLSKHTVLIHAVAVEEPSMAFLAQAGSSVVWCPHSNLKILGRTAPVDAMLQAGIPVCLGTDSTLTGSGGLLHELRVAKETGLVDDATLVEMVTHRPAHILRARGGDLCPGSKADLIAVPDKTGEPLVDLLSTRPHELGLVLVGGRPMIGGTAFHSLFASIETSHALESFPEGDLYVPPGLKQVRKAVKEYLGEPPIP